MPELGPDLSFLDSSLYRGWMQQHHALDGCHLTTELFSSSRETCYEVDTKSTQGTDDADDCRATQASSIGAFVVYNLLITFRTVKMPHVSLA